MRRKLTSVDVCEVSGYSRADLHALLRTMWPYCDADSTPRVAREFRTNDLFALSITYVLEHQCGMRRAAVSALGKQLHAALSVPRTPSSDARLIITLEPPRVDYETGASTGRQGVVVALNPIFSKLDAYLIGDVYPSLPLGMSLAASQKSGLNKRRQA